MWTLDGVRIFVQEINGEGSQIVPRLQPLSGQTVMQFFGYESEVNTLRAIVVGATDIDSLMTMRKTSTLRELVSPEGSLGNFYIKKVLHKRQPSLCQTMRPDLPEDAPVYDVDIELYPSSD